ncbi:hypothetical protein NHX12_023928 [Muraenolepis orangiensis]|uniref:Uracil-DNA glycosylase n=1 Tax=Muraenolepis orangiensis TaxID=630683 RepID=A0A9Q0EL80_9TELE|nr:hypothetical protein NHX12_023928 [Muraenolepis orangiensis]
MIGQKHIKSSSKKRVSKELGETEEVQVTPKTMKLASHAEKKPISSSSSSPQLSDEQLDAKPVGVGDTWFSALATEFEKPYFKQLMSFVANERSRHTVFPPAEQVFTWTQMCDIQDVKVVILGQDPYHGPNQAHGLCFSVSQPVHPPPSLGNIYKELSSDIDGFQLPGHGDLTGWATQGVLLLNAVLTVRANQANSHKDEGWERFTDAVICWLSHNLNGVVFLLWGKYAHKKGANIDRKRHHVLQAVHPSPLSAHRGFLGCKHFSRANELLELSGKEPINWTALQH